MHIWQFERDMNWNIDNYYVFVQVTAIHLLKYI